jgi:hypothetical protein
MGGVWVQYQEDHVCQPMAFAKSESITSEILKASFQSTNRPSSPVLKCILKSWNPLPFASEQRSHCQLLNKITI